MNQPKWLFMLLSCSVLAACGGSSSDDSGSGSSPSSESASSSSASSEPASEPVQQDPAQPDAVYYLDERTLPAVGSYDILCDTRIKLTFDETPTLGNAGSAGLYKTSDDTAVDTISVSGGTHSMEAADRTRTLSAEQIWVEGNTVVIAPQNGVLEAGTEYYVAIADGVIEGTLNGAEFVGLGKDAGWTFTTTEQTPSGNEVTVAESGEADFRTVQGALSYAMLGLTKDEAVTINIKNGTYREPLYLRNKNNLTLRGESRDGTVIQFTSNNRMNPSTSERALFLVESADRLLLEDLTIENTTLIGEGGQAEALYFNSPHRLVAKNAAFISEQDTLLLKGYSWFYQSLVAGNVDYIWGTADVALFEESEIRTIGRSDGGSGGYILQARTPDSVKGFVFLNSELTRGPGPNGNNVGNNTFALARSGGSAEYYDNVVFVNTRMDDHIRPEAWHTSPTPNPSMATATNGWREYNSMDMQGNPMDTSSWVSYPLNQQEYEAEFSSRAKIFSTYNNGQGWNPEGPDSGNGGDGDGAADGNGNDGSDGEVPGDTTDWVIREPASGTPDARHEADYIAVDERLYLIGGRGNRAVNVYNALTNRWASFGVPRDENSQELRLHHYQSVEVGGRIYILGALIGGYPAENPVGEIYSFHPDTPAQWRVEAMIPEGRRRGAAAAANYDGKIYIVGGNTRGHNAGWVPWFDVYDPVAKTWTTLPDAPHSRDHHRAWVVDRKLYVMAGRRSSVDLGNGIGDTEASIDVYDLVTGQWSTLENDIPTPRAGVALFKHGSELVVAAGESSSGDHTEVEALNTQTGTWRSLPSLLYGRNAPGGARYGNGLFVVAGRHGNTELSSQEVMTMIPLLAD